MPGGTLIGAAFFIMVLLAALTSSISLMETIVSVLMDKFHIGRKTSCLIILGFSLALGIPSSLGYSAWSAVRIIGMPLLDFFDFISNSIMMPVVAIFTCVLVAFVLKPRTLSAEIEFSGKFKWRRLFEVVITYVAPVCILAILATSILEAFGVVTV